MLLRKVPLVQRPRQSFVSLHHQGDRILRGAALSILLAAMVYAATPDISSGTAPAGGWVQIKIGNVASGEIVMDLDPRVFGDIADASVFSANGDAYGSATISGRHLDARLFKPAGRGLDQAQNLPVLAINVPVLAGAPAGKIVAVTAKANGVSLMAGSVTIAGSLSVRSIEPGGGICPPARCFTSTGRASRVQPRCKRILWASRTYRLRSGGDAGDTCRSHGVDRQEIRAARFGWKRGRVFFVPAVQARRDERGAWLPTSFPAQAWSAPRWFSLSTTIIQRTNYVAIQNPNPAPVEVTTQIGNFNSPIKPISTIETIRAEA